MHTPTKEPTIDGLPFKSIPKVRVRFRRAKSTDFAINAKTQEVIDTKLTLPVAIITPIKPTKAARTPKRFRKQNEEPYRSRAAFQRHRFTNDLETKHLKSGNGPEGYLGMQFAIA